MQWAAPAWSRRSQTTAPIPDHSTHPTWLRQSGRGSDRGGCHAKVGARRSSPVDRQCSVVPRSMCRRRSAVVRRWRAPKLTQAQAWHHGAPARGPKHLPAAADGSQVNALELRLPAIPPPPATRPRAAPDSPRAPRGGDRARVVAAGTHGRPPLDPGTPARAQRWRRSAPPPRAAERGRSAKLAPASAAGAGLRSRRKDGLAGASGHPVYVNSFSFLIRPGLVWVRSDVERVWRIAHGRERGCREPRGADSGRRSWCCREGGLDPDPARSGPIRPAPA